MDSCGIENRHEATAIIDSLAFAIRTKRPKLCIFIDSPIAEYSLLVFAKRVNRFMPVYHE